MRKLKIFLLFMFLSVLVNQLTYPQFEINSLYNPVAGDSSVTIGVDTAGINPGEGGVNQVWNFSNIVQSGIAEIENFIVPSATPYFSEFPNSNLASIHHIQPSNYYHYFQASDSSLRLLGYASEGILANFVSSFPLLCYPISYGSQFSRAHNGIIYSGNSIVNIWGNLTVICDGIGTIILPSETIHSVLRLKCINEEYDTTRIGGVVVQTEHVTYTTYNWYRGGYKFQVFSLTEIVSNLHPFFKSIRTNLKNSPIGIKKISKQIPKSYFLYQNYPNPFNPSTNITFSIPKGCNVKLIIYNSLGKELAQLVNEFLPAGNYIAEWDALTIANGVYYYRLVAENYSLTRKMVLLK